MISLKVTFFWKPPKPWGGKGLTEMPKAVQFLAGRLEKCSPFHSFGLFTRLSGSHFSLKLSYHRLQEWIQISEAFTVEGVQPAACPLINFLMGVSSLNPSRPLPPQTLNRLHSASWPPTHCICLAVYISLSAALFITFLLLNVWMTKLWLIFCVLF